MLSVSVSGLDSVPPDCWKALVASEAPPVPASVKLPPPTCKPPRVGDSVPRLKLVTPSVTFSVPAKLNPPGVAVRLSESPAAHNCEPAPTLSDPLIVPVAGPDRYPR